MEIARGASALSSQLSLSPGGRCHPLIHDEMDALLLTTHFVPNLGSPRYTRAMPTHPSLGTKWLGPKNKAISRTANDEAHHRRSVERQNWPGHRKKKRELEPGSGLSPFPLPDGTSTEH